MSRTLMSKGGGHSCRGCSSVLGECSCHTSTTCTNGTGFFVCSRYVPCLLIDEV
ncbi:hypothetical protein BD769DRAFT_1573548 [Suillus cothurnatus]|nr:hypothetical protein BD769DRAFT_1573548 [Suillus cothurnatus]